MTILELAFSQYGIKEVPGEINNPQILSYFKEIGHGWVQDDETSWCSAFVNWVCARAGLEHTRKLDARSWLNIGEHVQKPQLGDIVVFWREKKDSWKGHVGFYINETNTHINVLGGNQNNMVCIKPYPKSRLLQYIKLGYEN